MVDVLPEVDLAGVHLAGALDVDLLALEEVVHLAVLLLLYAREGVGGLPSGHNLEQVNQSVSQFKGRF